MMAKLHELDPTARFSDRANDYAMCRPDYSDEAVRAILEGFDGPLVADVGAGTGISSRRLARNGARVIAIEPNQAMIEAAEAHSDVQFIVASAEETTLDDASVNIVACFQAFHWFRPDEALREFRRVLQRNGRLALVWNERDERDPFTRAYGDVIRKASNNHPAEKRLEAARAIYETPLFAETGHLRFAFEQRFDEAGLLGRATSASYLPNRGEAFEVMRRELAELHAEWRDAQGFVTLKYNTEVFLARVVRD